MGVIIEPKISDLPPTIIVHLVRHAQANFTTNEMSSGLSLKGERQCDDLKRALEPHKPYITNIICSPYGRCIDTARKALHYCISGGLKIDLMRALAGRETGNQEWTEGVGSFDNYHHVGRWVLRGPNTNDADFVKNWLSLREMPLSEAQKIREVVVVTHELFLVKLAKLYYNHAQVGTFRIDPDVGKLIPVTANELAGIRAEQAKWSNALEARQVIKKAEIAERFKQAVADAVAQALKTAETQLQMLKLDLENVKTTSV